MHPEMKAGDIMNRPVVAASPTTTARDAAIQMLMGGYSGLPITDPAGRVIGVVTEHDAVHALRSGRPLETMTADEIMTREPVTVDVGASVEHVMQILDEKRILRVPVTEEGRLVGVVSRPDVLRAFLEPKFMTFS